MICSPIGKTLVENPHGIEIDGSLSAFMPRVKRVAAARTSSSTPLNVTNFSPMMGAVMGVEGVNKQSIWSHSLANWPPILRRTRRASK